MYVIISILSKIYKLPYEGDALPRGRLVFPLHFLLLLLLQFHLRDVSTSRFELGMFSNLVEISFGENISGHQGYTEVQRKIISAKREYKSQTRYHNQSI